MLMIYNSPHYCVFEFKDDPGRGRRGFEIMHQSPRREIFRDGALALRFRENVAELIAEGPTVERIDAFLSRFDGLMLQPVTLH